MTRQRVSRFYRCQVGLVKALMRRGWERDDAIQKVKDETGWR
jgi:hypothetical protein